MIKNKKLLAIYVVLMMAILFSFWFYARRNLKSSSSNEVKKILSAIQKEPTIEPPSITKIFNDNHEWTATLSANNVRIVTATGDVIPARSVNYQAIMRKNPRWPYEKAVPTLQNYKSDVLLINLETPLIKNCPLTNEGMIFCGDSRNIEGLKYLGVNIANLANNHFGNYEARGIKETEKLLTENGIDYIGVGNVLIEDIRGIRFAFLGFNDIEGGMPPISDAKENDIINSIKRSKTTADVSVVAFHWGNEYQAKPTERQIQLAHLAIESGADLIIGNHPHWIQPVEIYKGKYIVYAHGNFVFDQMWSEKTKEGVVGRYVFYGKHLIDIEFLPTHIDDFGQVSFGDEKNKQKILEEMKKQSLILPLEISK